MAYLLKYHETHAQVLWGMALVVSSYVMLWIFGGIVLVAIFAGIDLIVAIISLVFGSASVGKSAE